MKNFKDFKLTLRYHDKLNPKIWNNTKLKPEVAKKLKLISTKWAKYASIPKEAIKDLILVGGNANFNYTRYSDIDLHLVVDKSKIADCPDLMDDFLADKKTLWGLTHNIKLYGHNVELYAQDKDDPFPTGQGVYSIKNSTWLVEPNKENVSPPKDEFVKRKVQGYIDKINYLIDNNADDEEVKKVKDKLREMRSSGIQKGGEFSIENIVFKELRNLGYVKKMIDYIHRNQDEKLSLK